MKINSNSIQKLIAIHVFLVVVFLFLWSVIGLPWGIVYIFDLLVCVEFAWGLRNLQCTLRRAKAMHFLAWLIIYGFFLILTQLFNFVSPLAAIMAFRRTFRFYLFFFACVVLLTEKNINSIMNMLCAIQIVNFLLTIYQYAVLKLDQDNLGGIFGIEKGANAYSNVYLCLLCTYMLIRYLTKKTKILPMVLTIGSALVIAVLAELKIFFIEILVIVLMGILLSNPSARTVKTIVFIAIGLVVAIALFGSLFPEHLAILLSWVLLTQYTTESIAGYRINRMNAFSEINKIFFKDNPLRNLFGYGFGNCEEGTAFYAQYSHYKYSWFTHQVSFLDTGFVGILFIASFFVLVYIFSAKSKKVNPENSAYYTLGQIMSVLCMIWIVYDASLRSEVAFMAFFALAIPLAIRNEWQLCQGRESAL